MALTTCEQALRDLFSTAYLGAYGVGWPSRVASAEQLEQWAERLAGEEKRRTASGVVAVTSDVLAYAEFWELCNIAAAHWEPLAPALGKQKATLPLLRRFEALRNTIAHSRPVLPFEADLLAGIAGEIRNRVTIYMSDQDPSGDYFARIETVTDSFGHEIVAAPAIVPNGLLVTKITLHVGDTVRFTCRATDPQDRALRWVLNTHPGGDLIGADGADSEMTWTAHERHVGQQTAVLITVAADTSHHRIEGVVDGRVIFFYRVLPRRN